jgi:hypothetical protein
MYYILDSNIWIDVEQRIISCADLTARDGIEVVVAPFMITELVHGLTKGGERFFAAKKLMFECMANFRILELPKVFIFKVLWNVDGGGVSNVRPHDYASLLEMLTGSHSLAQFLKKAEASDSFWKKMTGLHSIHDKVLDKELGSLNPLAGQGSLKSLPIYMSKMHKLGGLSPDPDIVELKFSAALEFLRAYIMKVRRGAKPKKNDRGMYVDSQLFYYLADPDAVIVSNEDFSNEIKNSPQRDRIISYARYAQTVTAPTGVSQ